MSYRLENYLELQFMIVGVYKTGYWSKLRPYFSKFGKISKFLSTLQILMEQLQIWRADDLAFGKLILDKKLMV